jgi:hypothetical protein
LIITTTLARPLIRERLYKRIIGRALCLGRHLRRAAPLLRQEGLTAPGKPDGGIGHAEKNTGHGNGTGFITDVEFLSALGLTDRTNMDVSTYEGAEMIHDLIKPIPESLVGQFDFIIDGGTCDTSSILRRRLRTSSGSDRPSSRLPQARSTKLKEKAAEWVFRRALARLFTISVQGGATRCLTHCSYLSVMSNVRQSS